MDMRTCTKCGETKPATIEYFYRSGGDREGLRLDCKACKNDARAEWRNANRERERATWNAYNARNRDSRREYARVYLAANREMVLEKERQRRAATPWVMTKPLEYYREKTARRRARKAAAPGSHSTADVVAQLDRQRGRCYWCHRATRQKYHVDHVVPLLLGGSDGLENLVIACPRCNTTKGAKHPMEWAGVMC